MKKIKATFTLSRYECGMHTFNESSKGELSFNGGLSELIFMIEKIGKGVKLGSKIKVTMEVEKEDNDSK